MRAQPKVGTSGDARVHACMLLKTVTSFIHRKVWHLDSSAILLEKFYGQENLQLY